MAFRYIYVPLSIQLIGLCFAVYIDIYVEKKYKKALYTIVVLDAAIICQEYFDYLLRSMESPSPLRPYISFLGYALRPLIILLFCYIVYPEGKHRIANWLVIGNTIIYFVSIYTGIAFSIDENNVFVRGPLGFTCHIVSIVILLYLLFMAMKRHKTDSLANKLFLHFIIAAIFVGAICDFYTELPISILTLSVTSSCILSYIWLHFQFVATYENALAEQQRVKLMTSQIRPHFLYNTLSTIQALCLVDPQKASETTEKFGTYIRHNINSINQPNLISLRKELEHTQIYVDIEKIRFPNIMVEYDIEEDDFLIPALSVQPMVENAIRHGIRGIDNGKVTVSAKKRDGEYQIIIKDNGVGFDVEKAFEADETHIGIRNVRNRVRIMCRGELTVNSAVGEGTEIIITIPISNSPKE